jgi:hypothetical protein
MRTFVLFLTAFFLLLLTLGYAANPDTTYQPTERIPADTEVSFPVDI